MSSIEKQILQHAIVLIMFYGGNAVIQNDENVFASQFELLKIIDAFVYPVDLEYRRYTFAVDAVNIDGRWR
jgi:hypothetical protein